MPFSGDSPFDDVDQLLDRLQQEIDRATRGIEGSSSERGPAVDLAERDEEYVLTADLPGFGQEEIDVSLVDRSVRIDAEHESETETDEDLGEDGRFIRQERRHQAVSRTIRLPGPVDQDAVSATYSNGVLTVTLPKASVDEGHRIEVE